jgi:ABC-2 type transport system permease protein
MNATIMKSPFVTLMKREFWEHKALWAAPLIYSGLFLCATVVGALFSDGRVKFDGDPGEMQFGGKGMTVGVYGVALQLFVVAGIVIGIYLLDCLYAERKDRSILFWKSLPVSDQQTVLAKFVVALVVVPLGVYLLALMLSPIVYGIATASLKNFAQLTGGWSLGSWVAAQGTLLGSVVATILWYAPVAAWLMLASVYSKRMPLLSAIAPWVALGVVEGILFQTGQVWRFIGWRLSMVGDPIDGFTRPGLWIGLAVAAGMLYIVVRLRRYRDDT